MRELKKHKRNKIIEIVKEHIQNRAKEYITVSVIFLIGIILGILFINQVELTSSEQIEGYLNGFVNSLKGDYQVDNLALLKSTAISNSLLALGLWFIGSTVVGIPLVYIMITVQGFCFGYAISSSLVTFGVGKGILFSLSSMLLQNLIFIPCILALAVSGMKLHQSITKDKRKENIKVEVYRHTLFSILIGVGLLIAAFIEAYGSGNLLTLVAPYL